MIRRIEGFMDTPDGEVIWFEVAGEGTPLMLAHGLGGNAAVWYQQVPVFARHHQVITWDQRGFGRSTNSSHRVDPRAAIADQVRLLDHLGVESVHLVGQSMGGWVALGTTLEAPDRVRSLVLASTTAGVPHLHVPGLDPSEIGPDGGTRPLGVHPAIGPGLAVTDPARAYLYQALGTFGSRPSDAEFARILTETVFEASRIGALGMPVLLICGSDDPIMTPLRVRDVAGRFADARVAEMPGLGHSPYFEDPDGWNAIVGGFLSSVEAE